MTTRRLTLTDTQARRAATSLASRIAEMDSTRPAYWWQQPAQDNLTASDQRYRAELLDAYDAIMHQLI